MASHHRDPLGLFFWCEGGFVGVVLVMVAPVQQKTRLSGSGGLGLRAFMLSSVIPFGAHFERVWVVSLLITPSRLMASLIQSRVFLELSV
jgi:hypothetical protein